MASRRGDATMALPCMVVRYAPMSEIHIVRKHKLTARKAKVAAEEVATGLREEFGLNYEWVDPGLLRFHGLGVKGELALSRGEVMIQARLGFLLLPFKASLEDEIHRYFDERFG